jgi:hypothetical protein
MADARSSVGCSRRAAVSAVKYPKHVEQRRQLVLLGCARAELGVVVAE